LSNSLNDANTLHSNENWMEIVLVGVIEASTVATAVINLYNPLHRSLPSLHIQYISILREYVSCPYSVHGCLWFRKTE
jgi:hypothetical protein